MNQPIVNRLYTSINKDSTLTEVMDAQYSAAAVGADCLIDFCMNSWVVPVQIRDDLRNLDILSRVVFKKLKPNFYVNNNVKWDLRSQFGSRAVGENELIVYPKKDHIGATLAVNTTFGQVFESVRSVKPSVTQWWLNAMDYIGPLKNDEAAAWLAWLYICWDVNRVCAKRYVLCSSDLKGLKDISGLIKGLGFGATKEGACLAECAVLAGRAVGSVSLIDDVMPRINAKRFFDEKAVNVDIEALKGVLRDIKRTELTRKPTWTTKEEFWESRWLHTKGGSHSQYADERILGARIDLSARPSRREFAENVKECIIAKGEPVVDAGASSKLEHGKTRMIYACDTESYFTFSYLIGPVEKAWGNKVVLLDPGRDDEVRLYHTLGSAEGFKLQLDYDDFNSQHTLESMKAVIEVMCEDADPEVLKWAVESFDNMYLHWNGPKGMRRDRMVGTLPSGHRATSFINTILNRAYILLFCRLGGSVVAKHTGDDVEICGSLADLERIIRDIQKSPVRMNPVKQSVGTVGEFLRVSFTDKGGCGYIARAVASLVSGNWANEKERHAVEALNSVVGGIWNINVRAGSRLAGLFMKKALEEKFPEVAGYAQSICVNSVSINGSPVYGQNCCDAEYITVTSSTKYMKGRVANSYATDDFLRKFVDVQVLKAGGSTVSLASLRDKLVSASYPMVVPKRGELKISKSRISIDKLVSSMYLADVKRRGFLPVGVELLFMRVASESERALLRMIFSRCDLPTPADTVPVNDLTLPGAYLMHYASVLGGGVYVRTSFPLLK